MSKWEKIKDIFTDVFGVGIMLASTYVYFFDNFINGHQRIKLHEWVVCLAVGIVLMWVADSAIVKFIKNRVEKK